MKLKPKCKFSLHEGCSEQQIRAHVAEILLLLALVGHLGIFHCHVLGRYPCARRTKNGSIDPEGNHIFSTSLSIALTISLSIYSSPSPSPSFSLCLSLSLCHSRSLSLSLSLSFSLSLSLSLLQNLPQIIWEPSCSVDRYRYPDLAPKPHSFVTGSRCQTSMLLVRISSNLSTTCSMYLPVRTPNRFGARTPVQQHCGAQPVPLS
jgi:hypothetical protein